MKPLLTLALLCTGLSMGAYAGAISTQTFTFTGHCTVDCTGTATATLVLQNYLIGNTWDLPNFVSFTYNSDILPNYTITNPDIANGQFLTLPGVADVFIENGNQTFNSVAFDGSWCVGETFVCASDSGTNHTWTVGITAATPEPAPFALVALPLVAFWYRFRRRRG